VNVSLPGIGGSRAVASGFVAKEAAIEALGYANEKTQEIKNRLAGAKLTTKDEKDARIREVREHVAQSLAKKIPIDSTVTPPPTTIVVKKKATSAKTDAKGVIPGTTGSSQVFAIHRPTPQPSPSPPIESNPSQIGMRPTTQPSPSPPIESNPSQIGMRLPFEKRPPHVLQDLSTEEASERANRGPEADDGHKPRADEKSLPLKKRRFVGFAEASPKQQGQDQMSPEKQSANNPVCPSPRPDDPTLRQNVMVDQATKLRLTLNGLIDNGVIEWRPSGLSFIIKKAEYLRATDFATLSAWGFDQIRAGEDLGAFIHPRYRRDQCGLPLLPARRSAKTNYCLSITQERYGSGVSLDVVIPRRSVSSPSSSFGIDLTYDADGWTRIHTRTGHHGWLRDGDIIQAVNGVQMFLPNSLLFNPSHQQKPMLHTLVLMACRRTPPGMPLTLRLFRENKTARCTSI